MLVLLITFMSEINPEPMNINKKDKLTWTIDSRTTILDFDKAFEQIKRYEGGYGNDPSDAGGETYCGISRISHPNWPGWQFIDQNRPIRYNKIFPELLDIGVNMGVDRAILMLKNALNLLNDGGSRYKDFDVNNVVCDDIFVVLCRYKDDKIFMYNLVKTLNGLQMKRYIEICQNNPKKEKYLRAWLKRV
jgi:hypothetical protein